jgi:hypothetical protein
MSKSSASMNLSVIAIALRRQRASHAAMAGSAAIDLKASLVSSALGAVFSFLAGLVYCLLASMFVYYLHARGV